MTRVERIKLLKEEMAGRDYEGVTTLQSASIFDLLAEYKHSIAISTRAIRSLKKIANMPDHVGFPRFVPGDFLVLCHS